MDHSTNISYQKHNLSCSICSTTWVGVRAVNEYWTQILIKRNGAGDAAQLEECLPRMHEALGSFLSAAQSGHAGAHL